MGEYFCGWYYRCQSDSQTLAIIPSVHKTKEGDTTLLELEAPNAAFENEYQEGKPDNSLQSTSVPDAPCKL